MIPPRLVPILVTLLATGMPLWAQQSHRVVETEPNDTPAGAKVAELGDTLVGTVSSTSDVDFFALDIPAGAFVTIHAGQKLCLFDRDGVTLLECNSEDWGASFPFTAAGRYYIRVDGNAHHMGEPIIGPYQLIAQAKSFSLAAGDPVRRFVDLPPPLQTPDRSIPRPDRAWRMAAGLNGELYIGTLDRVLRINPNGDTTTLASGLWLLDGDMVVDPFGDIIVAKPGCCGGTYPVLRKISPGGTVSLFPIDLDFSQCNSGQNAALAVGPDGDLWAGSCAGIVHLDPLGVKIGEIPLKNAVRLAVGPAGELFVAGAYGPCVYGVYVVRGSDIACSFPNIVRGQLEPQLELAAASDGSLYVGKHPDDNWVPTLVDGFGFVDMFSPGATASHRHAHVPRLQELTFARDPQGNMTSRLFAIEGVSSGTIVELSGADDRPVGAGFKVRFFHATLGPVPTASVGTAYNQTLHVTTDATGLTWTVAGALPPGLTLSASGVLQGTPTTTGSFAFTVRATSGERSWFAPGTIEVLSEVTVAQVTGALLGSFSLDPLMIEFLDQLGNRNGILDVGDLRAFLRARGQLSPH